VCPSSIRPSAGGTVDITCDEIVEAATPGPLELKEIAAPSGGAWGATSVDKGFMRFLKDLLGDKFRQLDSRVQLDVLSDWEAEKTGVTGADDDADTVFVRMHEILDNLNGACGVLPAGAAAGMQARWRRCRSGLRGSVVRWGLLVICLVRSCCPHASPRLPSPPHHLSGCPLLRPLSLLFPSARRPLHAACHPSAFCRQARRLWQGGHGGANRRVQLAARTDR
jgi:hypothetical protein